MTESLFPDVPSIEEVLPLLRAANQEQAREYQTHGDNSRTQKPPSRNTADAIN
jgi:hypothetical protein